MTLTVLFHEFDFVILIILKAFFAQMEFSEVEAHLNNFNQYGKLDTLNSH